MDLTELLKIKKGKIPNKNIYDILNVYRVFNKKYVQIHIIPELSKIDVFLNRTLLVRTLTTKNQTTYQIIMTMILPKDINNLLNKVKSKKDKFYLNNIKFMYILKKGITYTNIEKNKDTPSEFKQLLKISRRIFDSSIKQAKFNIMNRTLTLNKYLNSFELRSKKAEIYFMPDIIYMDIRIIPLIAHTTFLKKLNKKLTDLLIKYM